MDPWLEQALTLLSTSLPFRFVVGAIPVSITVAAIAGWRNRVEGAGALALFGSAFCIWLGLPWQPAYVELQQASFAGSILCWIWLVWGWGKHVFREWPSPIWGHWIVGTLLWVLPVTAVVVLLSG